MSSRRDETGYGLTLTLTLTGRLRVNPNPTPDWPALFQGRAAPVAQCRVQLYGEPARDAGADGD